MKFTQVLLVCLLGFTSVNCACGEGTLHCSSENVPTICDFTLTYALNIAKDGCEKKSVEGCEIINFDFSLTNPCLLCEAGKVMDTENAKCVAVPVDNVKDNCSRYDKTTKTCLVCAENYFIQGGNCVTVGETLIDNCGTYESATVCESCNSGFYKKTTKCEAITAVTNCYSHTEIQCDNCSANFLINRGLNGTVLEIATIQFMLSTGAYKNVMMTSSNTNSVCQATAVPKCLVFETFDKCTTCDFGYMVTPEKKCIYYPEDPIAKCIKYDSATNCIECGTTEYLLSNVCETRIVVENCKTYWTSKNECKVCNDTHYLAAATTCTARTTSPYKNCQLMDMGADSCNTCIALHTKTADNKACLPDITNCAVNKTTRASTFSTAKHICTECLDGYTLTNDACTGTPVAECADHTANTSTCVTCNANFYLSENTCLAQNVAGCDNDYVSNKNQCNTCVTLKKPSTISGDTPNTCVDISAPTNCVISNGTTDACTTCTAGFYVNGGNCATARGATFIPANCAENVGTSENTACSKCTAGKVNVDGHLPYATDTELTTLNCLKIDIANGKCKQCKDNHYLATGQVCTAMTGTTNACTRSTFNTTILTNLDGTTNCEKCNEAKGYYSNNGTCEDLPLQNLYNCATKGTSAVATCESCDSGYADVAMGRYSCSTDSTTRYTPITNCAVQLSPSLCYSCANNKAPSSDNTSCSTNDVTDVENSIDWVGAQTGNQSNSSVISNCAKYGQVNPGRTTCIECSTDFVGIVAKLYEYAEATAATTAQKTFTRVPFISHSGTKYGPDNSTYSGYTQCITKTNVAGQSGAEFDHASGTCATGVLFNTGETTHHEKYICIQCLPGSIGTVQLYTHMSGTTLPLSPNFLGIKTCSAVTDNSIVNGTGFGSQNKWSTTKVSENSMVNSSNCPANEIPVYSMNFDTTGVLPFKYLTTTEPNMRCTATSNLEYTQASGAAAAIAQCAAAIRADTTTTAISSTTTVNCIACKAGHKPTFTANNTVVSCAAIAECSAGTWLDSCMTPNTGKPFQITMTNDYAEIDFSVIRATTIANCAAAVSDTACYVCDKGFTPSADLTSCVALTTSNTGCTAVGIGETALKHPGLAHAPSTTDDQTKQYQSITALRYSVASFGSDSANDSVQCAGTCANSAMMFYSLNLSGQYFCGKSPSPSSFVTANDCSAMNAIGGCKTCVNPATHVVNQTQPKCELLAAISGCLNYFFSGTLKCNKCAEGYALFGDSCGQNYCKEMIGGVCTVCMARSRPSTDTVCLAPVAADDAIDCLHFNKDGMCVKCSADGKIPYNFTNGSDKSYVCMTWSAGAGEMAYVADYMFVNFVPSGPGFGTNEIKFASSAAWKDRKYHNFAAGLMSGETNCLPGRTVDNCKTFVGNVYCSECDPTHYLDIATNTCIQNNLAGCEVSHLTDGTKCTTCVRATHFKDGDICTARTTNLDCATFTVAADTCDTCATTGSSLKWLNSTGSSCDDYTANMNCDGYNASFDKCTSCAQGFYLTGNGNTAACPAATTVLNCAEYSVVDDKCVTCKDGFYKDITTPTTPSCPARTVIEFCTTLTTTADSCDLCEGDRYYNSTAKECRDYPIGTANCAIYTHPKTCVQCDSGYFLNSTVCEKITTLLAGCSVYSSQTACKTCASTHIINGTTCDLIVVKTGCIEYQDKDNCKTCSGNYFLESGACTASGITGCVTAVKGTPNTCTQCDSSRYANAEKTTCTTATAVSGCLIYKSQTECSMCSSGKLLNADGTACTTLTTQAGSECSYASTLAAPTCDVCLYGFKKAADGTCEAITSAFCVAEDASGKCMICLPGHSMDKDNKCTLNPEPPCTGDNCDSVSIAHFTFTLLMAFFTLRLF